MRTGIICYLTNEGCVSSVFCKVVTSSYIEFRFRIPVVKQLDISVHKIYVNETNLEMNKKQSILGTVIPSAEYHIFK